MKVEDIFQQYKEDPEYEESYVWSQLYAAERANSTTGLSDMACQFYNALQLEDRRATKIVNEIRFS